MRAALWTITLILGLTTATYAKKMIITLDDDSVVEGRLIDRLPDGYLLRVGTANRLISYQSVKSIQDEAKPAEAKPAEAKPVEPPPASMPASQPTSQPVKAPAPAAKVKPSKSNPFTKRARPKRTRLDPKVLAQEPPLEGKGMIVGGWVTFGVSSFVSLYSLLFAAIAEEEMTTCYSVEDCHDQQDTVRTLYNVSFFSAAVAAGGLTMAIMGHSARSRSKRQRKEWRRDNGLTAWSTPQVGPVNVDGAWGVGLSAAF